MRLRETTKINQALIRSSRILISMALSKTNVQNRDTFHYVHKISFFRSAEAEFSLCDAKNHIPYFLSTLICAYIAHYIALRERDNNNKRFKTFKRLTRTGYYYAYHRWWHHKIFKSACPIFLHIKVYGAFSCLVTTLVA